MRDLLDYGLSILSTMWSLENIDNVLGIILLVISIGNLVFKAIVQINDKIKNKKYDEIDDVVDELIKDIDEIRDSKKEE